MAMLSNLDLIRRVPLFAQLTPGQAESLADAVGKKRFKRGDYIVERGQTSNALFIILSGRARVMMTDSKGREVILAGMRTGDHIGEMSLIDGMPHSATVRAEVVTDVLVLGREDFARCIADNSAIAQAVMMCLCTDYATPPPRLVRWLWWVFMVAWPTYCWRWPWPMKKATF